MVIKTFHSCTEKLLNNQLPPTAYPPNPHFQKDKAQTAKSSMEDLLWFSSCKTTI
jgi:hypothetical protein